MIAAEKNLRKLGREGIYFLPVMTIWLQWCQTWNIIIRVLKIKMIDKTI